jgi:Uma2 family endonuclease
MNVAQPIDTEPLLVNIRSADLHVTPAQFDRLCQDNRDLRLELTKEGKLIVMAPTFGESGKRNGNLFGRVWAWNERTQLGTTFDSSTGYDSPQSVVVNSLLMFPGLKTPASKVFHSVNLFR